jgi:membrane protein required for colicin V production
MNWWLDIVIIVIAVIRAYIGWNQGFIRAAFSIVGLIVGILLAGQLADDLAETLGGAQWAYFVAFAIILIGVLVIADIIGGILKKFTRLVMLGWLDSLGGMILGLMIGALVVAAILTAAGAWAYLLPEHEIVESAKQGMSKAIGDSVLAELLIDKFRLVLSLLPGKFDAVREFFD